MALAIGLYLGAYFLLLERKVYRPAGIDLKSGQNQFEILPGYRTAASWVGIALFPAHRIDRQLRSEFWMTIENSRGTNWKNSVSPENDAAQTAERIPE
ncbi:MAG: hypothetical protein ACKV0T_18970 [Planctomycetales bacterium]